MPIYEYRCTQCGEQFEKWLRSMYSEDQILCPKCGSALVEKAVSRLGSSAAAGFGGLTDSSCAPSGG